MRAQMRGDIGKVAAALRAQPFDPAALAAVLEAQEARLNSQLSVGVAALRDFLVALPEADRLAFADRLEQRLKRKDDDRPPKPPGD